MMVLHKAMSIPPQGHSRCWETSSEGLPGPARTPRVSLMTPRIILRSLKKQSKIHDFGCIFKIFKDLDMAPGGADGQDVYL